MVDISQFGTVAGLAVLIGLIVQFAKTQIQTRYVPYFAIGLAVVLAVLFGWATGHLLAPADLVSFVVGGFLSGLIAIGGYESTLNQIKVGSSTTVLPAQDPVVPPKG